MKDKIIILKKHLKLINIKIIKKIIYYISNIIMVLNEITQGIVWPSTLISFFYTLVF
jgi:hypothetical protein